MYHTSDPVPGSLSRSTGSPRSRTCGMGFLQTPPHDDAFALLLTFGSTNTWYRDLHPVSYGPCPVHTSGITGPAKPGLRCINLLARPLGVRTYLPVCEFAECTCS
jgi:hypothetical protein